MRRTIEKAEAGVGELNILSTKSRDLLVYPHELEEVLTSEEEPDLERYLPHRRHETRKLPEYIHNLMLAKLNVDLKLNVHLLRTSLKRDLSPQDLEGGLDGLYRREHRHICLGTIQIRGTRILFNGVELDGEAFEKWLDVCLEWYWKDAGFTPERATELARMIGGYFRKVELRSLENLRRTAGDEAADQLLREGKITFRSTDGSEYEITDSAQVFRVRSDSTGRMRESVCVHVENEEELPRYDRVLAKYLVIRDHPEQVLDRRLVRPRRPPEIVEAYRELIGGE